MSDWVGITGSGAGDTVACPTRAAFPQCREPAGRPADRGNEFHAFARCVTLDPANRATYEENVSEAYRHTVRSMDLNEALAGLTILGCEVAFVLNVKERTCRRIGDNIDRKYAQHLAATGQPPLTRYDIPFTVDVLAKVETGGPAELDYKSGQHIGDIEEHWQRRISSTGLMFAYGADEAISRVAYIWESGQIVNEGHLFTILEAWDYCETMVEAIDAVVAARAKFDAGSIPNVFPDRERQCKYCAAVDYCPYWNNLVKSVSNKEIPLNANAILSDAPMTDTERGKAFDTVKDVLAVFGKLETKLKEFVHRGALPLDDKWEYSARDQAGRMSFDGAKARGLLVKLMTQQGASEEEIDAAIASLSVQGAPYPVIKKRKRTLPLLQKAG